MTYPPTTEHQEGYTHDWVLADNEIEWAMSDFVTLQVGDQLFGIPVEKVRDILTIHRITPIPLASKEIEGALNLRGRIVTAINLRHRLSMEELSDTKEQSMHVVISLGGELYSLVVDTVGEVVSLRHSYFEPTPMTLNERWRSLAEGIYRLPETIIVILDVNKLLNIS